MAAHPLEKELTLVVILCRQDFNSPNQSSVLCFTRPFDVAQPAMSLLCHHKHAIFALAALVSTHLWPVEGLHPSIVDNPKHDAAYHGFGGLFRSIVQHVGSAPTLRHWRTHAASVVETNDTSTGVRRSRLVITSLARRARGARFEQITHTPAVAAEISHPLTLTSLGEHPPPSLGEHVAEYLRVAAAARSLLIGEVQYDFTANAPALKAPGTGDGFSATSHRPLRIAQYSHVYGPSAMWSANLTGCDRPCVSVGGYGNATTAAGADVVVINMMDPAAPPWARPPGQLWVGAYFESPDHYQTLRDASRLSRFNYTTGYRPDADFPLFTMVQDTASNLNRTLAWPIPSYELKQRQAMMATWISNCDIDTTGRLALLDSLALQNVTIASYGKCGPGRTGPAMDPALDRVWRDWAATGGPGAQKAATSSQHLFMFAAENSACAYYVTEKVWHAFLGGAVPVYVGDAAFLKKLTPSSSVIYAADFESPAALASHLKHLATDRSAYESYLAWRADSHALDPLHRFMALPAWEVSHARSRACALCEFLWAAPRRTRPAAASDVCEPLVGGGRARFRLRLL
jgi:hypothetical protein